MVMVVTSERFGVCNFVGSEYSNVSIDLEATRGPDCSEIQHQQASLKALVLLESYLDGLRGQHETTLTVEEPYISLKMIVTARVHQDDLNVDRMARSLRQMVTENIWEHYHPTLAAIKYEQEHQANIQRLRDCGMHDTADRDEKIHAKILARQPVIAGARSRF